MRMDAAILAVLALILIVLGARFHVDTMGPISSGAARIIVWGAILGGLVAGIYAFSAVILFH